MSTDDIVRSWKDPDRPASGTAVAHPAGEIELDDLHGGLAQEEATFTCTFIICTWARPCDPSVYFSCTGGCDATE